MQRHDPGPPTPETVVAPGTRGSTQVIHRLLRGQILAGDVEPGAILSQAGIAKDVGVSRGPVREAFRLLEREGLIETQINHRATVTEVSLDDIEHTYCLRVVNECVALAVGVPRFTEAELAEMDGLLAAIDAADPQDFEDWERCHGRFHELLSVHGGARMRRSLAQWRDHTERYRRLYVADVDGGWKVGAAEHAQLVAACRAREVADATHLLARHLSRAGLTLVAAIDPTHDPALLRTAVRQVTGTPT